MCNRNLFVAIPMACLLAVGFIGLAPVANAESGRESFRKPGKSAKNIVIEIKRRNHGPRIPLPIGPSSVYYDYPNYYSRGYYPTHIGGYVYYPYSYYRSYYWGYKRGPGSPHRQRGA
jgi:hypothetical protein